MTSRIFGKVSDATIQQSVSENIYDTNTLSHRLKYCLKLYSITQSELARRIDVKPQIIQYLCTKNIKSSRFTFELAEALEVDYTWLSTGEGSMKQPIDTTYGEHRIPFLSWDDLDKITVDDIANHCGDFIHSSLHTNCQTVATKINDESMEPRFEKNTTIIMELTDSACHGDFVLVQLNQSKKWLFRQLRISQQYTELYPINNSIFKELTLNPEDQIRGILVQTIFDFKRERL